MIHLIFIKTKLQLTTYPTLKSGLILLFLALNYLAYSAPDLSLKVHYQFNKITNTDSITDETGNGYNARLIGGAGIKKLGDYNVAELGTDAGYVDMGSKMGALINTLNDFTISCYLYVQPAAVLTNNGNFVWTFSNSANIASSPAGCLFYTAKDSRYAISTTNYSAEKEVRIGTAASKGSWKHITYSQSGNQGSLYIDGELKKTGTVDLLPSTLGATAYNYLFKSSYSSDQLLLNSMISDFRIYNKSLSISEITNLASELTALDSLLYAEHVNDAATTLSLGDISALISDLTLPASGANNVVISWNSSSPGIISNTGVVVRPVLGSETADVLLTATLSKNGVTITKEFAAKVLPYFTDKFSVSMDSASLNLAGNLNLLRSNLILPTTGTEGSSITWSTNAPELLSASGTIISFPAKGNGNGQVILTATITKGTESATKAFTVYVAEDEGFAAYLFAYFTGNNISQEAIRFAISDNGYIYKALNNDNPVINSAAISSTGGVRDPHILRGENGNSYYMVVTDMVSAQGWSSNRAMVLLKSTDLINWQSSIINIPNTFPVFSSADRIWAPQTIYDPAAGKYMVYFSMRLGPSDYDKIYYAYVNSDFTALETTPKQLFYSPTNSACIDGDIVYNDGLYHLFFKTEGSGNGIKKAVSNSLTEGYVQYDKYLQSTTNAVEGGCVFRLYNTDNFILMYDMYTSGAYQFTSSTDLLNFSVVSNTVSFDFSPRHGTVIPITSSELQALKTKWLQTSTTNKIEPQLHINAFPNPASDFLHLTLNETDFSASKLSIFDFKGMKILEQSVKSNDEKINVSALSPGLYLLRYTTNNKLVAVAKFFVI
jgi:hypothetical protein